MNTLKFSQNSWHYRFIKRYTTREDYQLSDICAYTRGFLVAAFYALLAFAGITLLAFAGTQVLVGIAFSLWNGLWIFSPVAEIAMAALAGVSLLFGSLFAYCWAENYLDERRKERMIRGEPDGFVTNAYKSWKDKWCARVEIIEIEEQK